MLKDLLQSIDSIYIAYGATDFMKFQWPKSKEDMEKITKEQLNWLLSGLKVCPEKYFKEIEIKQEKIAI